MSDMQDLSQLRLAKLNTVLSPKKVDTEKSKNTNVKFRIKQLERLSKRAEKDERIQRNRSKKAIQQSNVEAARIYAEIAIMRKNEALNYLRMASNTDAFASEVQSAITMETVTRNVVSAAKVMDKAIKSIDPQEVSAVMERFKQQCEDLDAINSVIEDAVRRTTTPPLAQVHSLLVQVAEENGLDIMDQLAAAQSVPFASISAAAAADRSHAEKDALSRRKKRRIVK